MKLGNNNEKQLIELLKDMPSVKDSRDKNELFQRISSQLDNEQKPVKKRKIHLIPIFSTLLVVAIMLVIIPAVLNNDMFQTHEELSSNKAADSGSSSDESSIKMDENEGAALSDDEGNPEFSLFNKAPESYVLTETDEQTVVVHAAISDQQGQYMIPLSFILPKTEELATYYNQLENYIKAKEWGVSEYLFKDVSFKFDHANNRIMMKLPEGFSLGQGHTNANMFEDALSTMFSHLQFDKVVFETVNNQGIDLGSFGHVTELPINSGGKSSYKLYQASEGKRTFLIPIPQQDKTEIDDAIDDMKQNEEAFNVFQTVPNDMGFTIETSNKQLTVTFSEDNPLLGTSLTIQEKVTMIDAILMTAKSYGYNSVKFRNAGIDQVGSYNLKEAIKVPLAVNPIRNET